MSESWGQPVVIDNRPGAAGNIGNDIAAKAPPDGYTIVLTTMSTAISMREINRIYALPEISERFSGLSMDPMPISVDRFNAMVASEVARWAKVIKDSGTRQE